MTSFRIEATVRLKSVRGLINLSEDHAAFWRFVTVCKWDKPKLGGNKKNESKLKFWDENKTSHNSRKK